MTSTIQDLQPSSLDNLPPIAFFGVLVDFQTDTDGTYWRHKAQSLWEIDNY